MISTFSRLSVTGFAAATPSQPWLQELNQDALFSEFSSRAQAVRFLLADSAKPRMPWGDNSVMDAMTLILGKPGFHIEPHIENVLALDEDLEHLHIDDDGSLHPMASWDLSAETFFRAESARLIHKRLSIALSALSTSSPLRAPLTTVIDITERIQQQIDIVERFAADTMPPPRDSTLTSDIKNVAMPLSDDETLDPDEEDEWGSDATAAMAPLPTAEGDEDELTSEAQPGNPEEVEDLDYLHDDDFDTPRSTVSSDEARVLNDCAPGSSVRSPSVLPASSSGVNFGLPADQCQKLESLRSSLPPNLDEEIGSERPLGHQLVQAIVVSLDVFLENCSD